MATPTLETERLILRPIQLSDAPAIQRQISNPNVLRFMSSVPSPYPDGAAHDYLSNVLLPDIESGAVLSWAITIKALGIDLVGVIDYRMTLRKSDTGNRGFWLAEPYWGQGYVTEAVVAVQDYVFGELDVERIIVCNAVENHRSSAIKRKTGGRLLDIRNERYTGGEVYPTEFWEITQDSWRQSKNL